MSVSKTRQQGRVSIPRILLCGVLLTILMAGCLYLYHTAFPFYRARLLDNESKTMAWLVGQLSFILPLIVICLFQVMVYHKQDTRDGTFRREMFWEVVVVAVLTYAVLLPYLASISEALYVNALAAGETIPRNEGKVEITLLMELHEWFIRLSIPLGILMVYHGCRARREIQHPETEAVPAPPMTVAEYEARKAAKAARLAAEAEEVLESARTEEVNAKEESDRET